MRFVRTAIIAGIATAALAGAALAAHDDARLMLVALPDGSVQHIRYPADAAPHLVLISPALPSSPFDMAFGPASPFAEMERISAAMDAQAEAMLRQAAALQAKPSAPADGPAMVMTDAQGRPVGLMRYNFVSTATTADGCTSTISYSSDAAAAGTQPKVLRTGSGACGEARPGPLVPATAAQQPVVRTRAAQPMKPITVTPVRAPRPLPAFTPSRT